jgi:hypothetical protein
MRIAQNSKVLSYLVRRRKTFLKFVYLKFLVFPPCCVKRQVQDSRKIKLFCQQNIEASKQDKNTNHAVTLEDIQQLKDILKIKLSAT